MEFRKMVRFKQGLEEAECIEVLKETKRGVLAVLGDGDYPYAVPINHYYCEADGKLYFHGGKFGHKIDAIKRHDKVSFCTWDDGYRKEGEWALNFRSIIVFGHVEFVEDEETMLRLARELSYKFTKDEAYIDDEIRRAGFRTLMFALVPEHISGKRVNEA